MHKRKRAPEEDFEEEEDEQFDEDDEEEESRAAVKGGRRGRKNESEGEDDGEDESGDEELAEEMRAAGAFARPASAPVINNKAGLIQALAAVRQDLPWVERLEVVSAEPAKIADVHNDLEVEVAL